MFRAIRAGRSVSAAAREANVHRRLIYAWCERGDSELKALLDERRERGTLGRGVAARDVESDVYAEPPPKAPSIRRKNWLAGQAALVAIASDPDHRDRCKAAEALVRWNDRAADPPAEEPAAQPAPKTREARRSASDPTARFRLA